ncbi:unnamed protein product [Rotaria magnacalcarata]
MATAADKSAISRFLDVGEEPNQVLLPIRGYENQPLLSLRQSVEKVQELLLELDLMVDTALQNSEKPADNFTVEESAAIHLYTMQWEEPNVSLYEKLNSTLRSERREPLRPWFPYLKLLLTALFKLSSQKTTVWRGVRGNLSDQYDEDHVWWGFSSCTEHMEVMERFIGQSGVRTLFNIECINGKAIRPHSFFKKESEILLLPGSYFRVVGKWSPAKDLYMIHLRETAPPRTYLEPPFKSSSAVEFSSIWPQFKSEPPAMEKLAIAKEKYSSGASTSVVQAKVDWKNARWSKNGVTVAGNNGCGSELNQLNYPHGIYVDDDQTVYIADKDNNRIVAWKSGAAIGQVMAGGNGEGNRLDQLNWPTDVIVDKETDSLIICDRLNKRVVQWSRRSQKGGKTIIKDIGCHGLVMDDRRFLYVSDDEKHEVRRYRMGETNGTVVAGGNGEGNCLNQFQQPNYICVDRDYSVYVGDKNNHRVMKWVNGAKEGIIAVGGQGVGNGLRQLSYPAGVLVDPLGTAYVADWSNNRVIRWCSGATQADVIAGGNGEGRQANQFTRLEGLSFDRYGNLYVADYSNHRVQRFAIEQ